MTEFIRGTADGRSSTEKYVIGATLTAACEMKRQILKESAATPHPNKRISIYAYVRTFTGGNDLTFRTLRTHCGADTYGTYPKVRNKGRI